MKLVLAEKPSVAQSLAKVLLAKILSNPVLHLHREYCKLGFHLKNGTPHSRYFSDELGVPIILTDTEQMFALQRDAWYNINVNIVYYLRKKNYFRRKKKCVFFTVSFCTVCEISKTESRDLYADCIQLWSRN